MSRSPVALYLPLTLLLTGACLLLPSPALGQEPAEGAAEEATETELQTLIQNGAQSYEQGDFQAAIDTFSRVLALDPDNALALYERALAHAAAGDHSACAADAQAGVELDSSHRAGFFAAGGTCLATSGKTQEALRMFRRGLARYPDDTALLFNIAITLGNNGQEAEACSHLESLLRLEPNHRTANFVLASLYQERGHRVPAVYQYLRFLAVEPRSQRSAAAASSFLKLLNLGLEQTEDNKYQVSIPFGENDGDAFRELNVSLSLLAGAAKTEEYQQLPYAAQLVEILDSLVASAQESRDPAPRATFVWKHAIAFLIEMREAGVLRTFGFFAFSQLKPAGAEIWLAANRPEVKKLSDWMKARLEKP